MENSKCSSHGSISSEIFRKVGTLKKNTAMAPPQPDGIRILGKAPGHCFILFVL